MTTNPRTSTNILGLLDEAQHPTPWLVKGWLVEGELLMIHGPAHVGKTYVALDLGLRIASGSPDWHGFKLSGQPRPVLYVPSEGRKGVSRRLGSWLKVHMPDVFALTEYDLAPRPVERFDHEEGDFVTEWQESDFTGIPFERYEGDPTGETPYLLLDQSPEGKRSVDLLAATAKALGDEHGRSPLIIVDVVGDFAPTSDENSRDFGHALAMLKPDNLGGGTVIVIHHEGWTANGRPRGHSSIDGLVDARLGLDARDNGTDTATATLTYVKVSNPKQRNEDKHNPIVLIIEKPIPGLVNPVVTGRPVPVSEGLLLRGWGKNGTPSEGDRSEQTERFSPLEVEYLNTVRRLGERPEHGGVVTPGEVRDLLNVGKSTEHARRQALLRKGFLAETQARGQGSVVLTPAGIGATNE